jgi:hypothetical protein
VNIYIPEKINAILIQKKFEYVSISVIIVMLVGSAIIPYGSIAFAQQSQNSTSKTLANTTSNTNATGAMTNKTALLKPGNPAAVNVALAAKMLQLLSSNKPKDIATLAYIWGYPLVTIAGSYAYYTTKGVPNLGEGPVNTINFARSLSNTSWVQYVSPNVNVLYGNAWMNLAKGPLVLLIPPIPQRYYVMQFMDPFGQVFAYVGARATGNTGGTFLIAGPNWNGIVPNGMHEIKTPTNIAWISNRIFVNGTSDLPNVHAIQNQIKLVPLSVLQGNATSAVSPSLSSIQAAIKASDKTPNPAMIPAAGIKVYDGISQAMVGNPQTYPPPDPLLLAKFASIGVGPGKTPSQAAATNSTLNAALQAGITEGEKLINAKITNIGTTVNGWLIQTGSGTYGTDYLLRAAVAKYGLGANAAEEAFYPVGMTDSSGKNLTGGVNYTIHFKPSQIPPVNKLGFWSITMYNSTQRLVPNPINRYWIGADTPGIMYNKDGSLDVYIQPQSPGQAKQNNWLPSPTTNQPFNMVLRLYWPDQPQALNGTWSPPPIQRANATG